MKNKIALVGILAIVLAVFAVSSAAALPIPDGKSVIVWFEPDPSSAAPGEEITVQMKVNTSVQLSGFADWPHFDSNHVNITKADWTGSSFPTDTVWSNWPCPNPVHPTHDCHGFDRYVKVAGMDEGAPCEPNTGELLLVTLTLKANNSGTSQLYHHPGNVEMYDCEVDPVSTEWVHGNFTCTAPVATYSKDLPAGWNLISLPLTSSNNNASEVLETVAYDAVFRYNANVKAWEGVATMDPGIGYFVNVTAPGQTWTYNGTAYEQMNVSIEKGLNMVGWLNCSMNVTGSDDALSSLDGKYNYAARFNATSQRFEAYEPHAPPAFNDFTTMDRGTGYFISARAGCPPLDKSCPL